VVVAAAAPGLGIAGAEVPRSRVAGGLGHLCPIWAIRDTGGASTALGLDGGEEGRGQEPAAGEDIRGAGVPGDGTGVKWRSPASASAELAVGASANHRI
jgi:hypothetical protein